MTALIVLDLDAPVFVVSDDGVDQLVLDQGAQELILNEEGPQGRPATSGFGCFIPGPLTNANQMLFRWPSIGLTLVSTNLSRVIAKTAATASCIIGVYVNGVLSGTIVFGIGQLAATVTLSFTQLNDGDILELIGPAVPDIHLADITAAFLSS
jgi:hypothetical protein